MKQIREILPETVRFNVNLLCAEIIAVSFTSSTFFCVYFNAN